jgi:hypothetical protein
MYSCSTPIYSTFLANLILLDLIFVIKSEEEYKLRSFSVCNFLHPPEEMRNEHKMLVESLKGRNNLEDPVTDERIILK